MRLRVLSPQALMGLMLLISIPQIILAQDVEPNGSIATASNLGVPATINGDLYINPASEADDYFLVELPSDGALTVTLTTNSPLGAYLYIYNKNGAQQGLVYAGGSTASLTQDCLGQDTVYVRIWRSVGSGTYTVSTTFAATPAHPNDVEPNNSIVQVNRYFNEGETISGHLFYNTVSYTDNNDYFGLLPTNDGSLTLNSDGTDGFNMYVYFYNKNGTELSNQFVQGTHSNPISMSIDCIGSDTLYVRIFRSTGCGSYNITYQGTPVPNHPDDIEPNNTLGQVNRYFDSGETIAGYLYYNTVDYTDNNDYFGLLPTDDGSLTLNSDGTDGFNMYVYFYNKNGTELANHFVQGTNANPLSLSIDCIGSDTLYVRIFRSTGCGTYTIEYQGTPIPDHPDDVEPNNVINQVDRYMSPDDVVEGHFGFNTVNYTDNDDYYGLLPGSDGSLTLHAQLDPDDDAYIYFYNKNQAQLSNVFVDGLAGGTSLTIDCMGSDTLYARVSRSTGCGSYSLTYTNTALPLHPLDVEPNNSVAQANHFMSIGETVEGHFGFNTVNYTDNNDYYGLIPEDDGSMTLTATLDADDNVYIYFYRKDGSQINSVFVNGAGGAQSLTVNCIANDTLYARVSRSTGCGSYSLTFDQTPPAYDNDIEPNGSIAEAIPMGNADMLEGHLSYTGVGISDLHDYYSFEVTQLPFELDARITLQSGLSIYMYLFNSAGVQLSNSSPLSGTSNWNYGAITTVGTYYLRVTRIGGCGGYALGGLCGSGPTVNVTPPGPFNACADEITDLTATAGFSEYTWLLNGSPTATGQMLPASEIGSAGAYSVVVFDLNQCSDTSNVVQVDNAVCDDGDPCTDDICTGGGSTCNNVYSGDDDSDGTCNNLDLCPNDPNKIAPGSCGCGNPDPGESCDDGDAGTENDVVQSDCSCAGTTIPTENTAFDCGDGVDNDGDGLIDCDDPDCQALTGSSGCQTCFDDGLSFADVVLEHLDNCSGTSSNDPTGALGVPDFTSTSNPSQFVSLGNQGYVKLGFTNNTLSNSGDSGPDLWVFEIGPSVEASNLELRPLDAATETACGNAGLTDSDLDGYYEFGGIGGSTASLDIDALVPGNATNTLFFDAVKVVSVSSSCSGNTPGPDIDAVCALSSINCIPGEACNDGDPTTINDQFQGDCTCLGVAVPGCMDPSACNYNSAATVDDGSCDGGQTGCDTCSGETDGTGTIIDNPEVGTPCNDGDAGTANDQIQANCQCAGEDIVPGCTNPLATNYEPNATVDNGTCHFDPLELVFNIPSPTITEGGAGRFCTIIRNGGVANALTVDITPSDMTRFTIPAQVSMAVNQYSKSFYIYTVNNELLEGDIPVDITVAATGHISDTESLLVIDDEIPQLSISGLPDSIPEGGQLTFSVSTNFPPTDSLWVNIISSETVDVPLQTPVLIEPGMTSTNIDITLPNDSIAETDETVTITAGSAGLSPATDSFILTNDEDIPAISIILINDSVVENSGIYATQAVISRTSNINSALQINIASSDPASMYLPSSVPMAPGQMEKTFYVGVLDNNFVDGYRDITLTASVLINGCNCSAPPTSAGVVSDTLTIVDNDGPSLSVQANPLSLQEGVIGAGSLTITRNTDTADPLTVYLSHNDTTEISLPSSVIIPGGSAFVVLPIDTKTDALIDGNQQVTINVSSPGFSPGIIWVIVTDINKPDLQISSVTTETSIVPALSQFQFHAFVTNQGVSNCPPGAVVKGYLSFNGVIDANDELIGQYIIDDPILVGETIDLWDLATAPYQPGNYNLIFEVNGEALLTELIYINNASIPIGFEVLPDYLGSAIVDNSTFSQGQDIPIHGSSFNSGGDPVANAELEVYILNGPYRREILVTTDSQGNYSTVFEPLATEADHYTVGASFPDQNATEVQDEFDIMGVELNGGDFIVWEFLLGDTIFGQISVDNLSNIGLTNVTMEALSLPSGGIVHFDTIPSIPGNTTASFNFYISSTEVSPVGFYQQIPLHLNSDQGVTKDQLGFFFCQALQGNISASISSINRTVSQMQSNFLEFEVYNNGLGETGEITIDIPPVDFISIVSMDVIPNLSNGDTSLVILEFIPTAALPLNNPASGTIVLFSESANALTIPYTIEKVSEQTGDLLVDVIDQYTYFTDEAPHVDSAFVKISHYFTGVVYAEGYTDAQGHFLVQDLPEGTLRLQVQAVQHDGYDNVIDILPGTTNTETVFLNYQAISFTWNVVPTTIEDSYLIDLNMEFEANVPLPVVTIEMPDEMPELFNDDTFTFFVTMTNHGLIAANDVELFLPTHPTYEFVTSYVTADLPAQSAIQVPVTMQFNSGGGEASDTFNNIDGVSEFLGMEESQYSFSSSMGEICSDFVLAVYWYECGDNGLWQQAGELFSYAGTICTGTPGDGGELILFPVIGATGIGNPGCFWCPTVPTGGVNIGPGTPSTPTVNTCQNCLLDILLAAGGCYPPTAAVAGVLGCIKGFATADGSAGGYASAAVSCAGNFGPQGCVKGIVDAAVSCFGTGVGGPAGPGGGSAGGVAPGELLAGDLFMQSSSNTNPAPPIVDQVIADLYQTQLFYEAELAYIEEFFGLIIYNENVMPFAFAIDEFVRYDLPITSQDSLDILDELSEYDIPPQDVSYFIGSWNQTLEAIANGVLQPNATYPDMIDQVLLSDLETDIDLINSYANDRGFISVNEMHQDGVETLEDQGEDNQQGVCSTVSLSISQELTMTREAFEGTLTVNNGHPTDAVEMLALNLEILDPNGVLSNDLFQIETTNLSVLTGIDGTGVLESGQEGSAIVLFIPEPAAAPTVPITYSFGGTISYLDPFTDLVVTLPLIPSYLQVNPSPNLYLHYFMQRNIYGDDPLTSSVEPIIPGELAVMIENNGYGIAQSVLIESGQPEIVDNEDGLAIQFSLIGSNLQGQPANLGLNNINFGNISPLSTKIGQWYFTSTLLGHFTNYSTNLVHLDSYGNPNLSLIEGVELHELIQSIEVYGGADDGIHDFLVNEVQDNEETPDAIYLSQGNLIYEVFAAQSGSHTGNILATGNTTQLLVDPLAIGWNYIKLDDPGDGNFEILSITRNSDGLELPLKNAWLTHVTLPDGQEPDYEDKFHFVDDFTDFSEVSYTVVWSPKDPNPPFVVSITGHPTTVSTEQVTNLTVAFSEDIIDSTFTTEDMMLTFQGSADIIDSTVVITEIDSVTYDIDLSTLTVGNGFYNFTVQCAGIEDLTATSGEVGEFVTWTQFLSVPSVQQFIGLPDAYFSNAFDTVQVLFNLPIDLATISEADFSISMDGIPQTGTLALTSLNPEGTLFKLSGLGSFMSGDGVYELGVDLFNIMSQSGESGLTIQTIDLTLDTQSPSLINMVRFLGNGLDAQHYTGVTMNFDEDVMPYDTAAVELWRNGIRLYPLEASVFQENAAWYEIESFNQMTYPDGTYTFKLLMDSIHDQAGNYGSGTAEHIWSVNRSPALMISGLGVSPDMGFSTSDGVTATSELLISFGISDSANAIRLYQNDNGQLTLLSQLGPSEGGAVEIPVSFDTGGNTAIYIEVDDTFGNLVTAGKTLYVDEVPLSAVWDYPNAQVLSEHPALLPLIFSHQLLDPSEVNNALIARYNNTLIDASGLSLQFTSSTEYELTGIESLGNLPGNYKVGIDLTALNKYTSGIAGASIKSLNWTLNGASNSPPLADAGVDTMIVTQTTYILDGTGSTDLDGDDLMYTWYAPVGITLSGSNTATPSFEADIDKNGTHEFLLSVNDGLAFATDIVEVIIDISDLIFACPPNAVVYDLNELADGDFGDVFLNNPCETIELTFEDNVPTLYCDEPIERTHHMVDDCGLDLTCVQEIAFIDSIKPTIICPPDTILPCFTPAPFPDLNLLTITDECDAIGSYIDDLETVDGCVTIVVRTYQAVDAQGNNRTCSQTLTLVSDTEDPVFSYMPPDTTLNCSEVVPFDMPEAIDCSEVFFEATDVVYQGICPYSATITHTVTDQCGNTASYDQVFNFELLDDCPQDITGDGVINVSDFIAMNSAWGTFCSGCPEDLNGDGYIGIYDFIEFNSVYGSFCPTISAVGGGDNLQQLLEDLGRLSDVVINEELAKIISDMSVNPILVLYPNPTNGGSINLSLNGMDESSNTLIIQVMDMTGRTIHAKTVSNQIDFRTELVFDTDLSNGMYTVVINSGNDVVSEKFIVNRFLD